MASWSETTKHEPGSINGGQRYEKGDRVSREQLNSLAENSFYAVNKSDNANATSQNALSVANKAFDQSKVTGTQVTIGGVFQSTFDADTKADENKRLKVSNLFRGSNSSVAISNLSNYTYLIISYQHGDYLKTHTEVIKLIFSTSPQVVYTSAYAQPDANQHYWGKISINYSTGVVSMRGGYDSTEDISRLITSIDGVKVSYES